MALPQSAACPWHAHVASLSHEQSHLVRHNLNTAKTRKDENGCSKVYLNYYKFIYLYIIYLYIYILDVLNYIYIYIYFRCSFIYKSK